MSVTLSPPVRVAALVGILVATGLAAFVLLLGRGLVGDESAPVATANPTSKPATQPSAATPRPAARTRPRVTSGFPAKVDRALAKRKVVVVSVSVPGGAVDAVLRHEARTAAAAAKAAFVTINTDAEQAVAALVSRAGLLPSPAVVIVRRPDIVVKTFSVTDAGTIAQAVAQARR